MLRLKVEVQLMVGFYLSFDGLLMFSFVLPALTETPRPSLTWTLCDTCFLASDFTTVFLETSSGQTGKYQDKKLINKNSNKKRLRCVFAKTTEDYVAVKSPISFFLVKRKLWMHLSTRCCRYVVKFLCQINYACCVTRRIKSLLV